MPRRTSLPVFVLLLAIFAGPVHSQVITTFDTDLEGWLILGDNAGTWLGAGGNPDGCMDVNDLATGQLNLASAPAQFLGDWSAFTSADTLAFDIYFANAGGTIGAGDWIFHIEGPGGAARGIAPGIAPPLDVWSTYAIAIDGADWVIESGTWNGIVADVTSLKLRVEYVDGSEEVRVDNVRLTSQPTPVFDPCAYSDFNGTGLDDWSLSGTGAVSNPANGDGNSGGFLQVADNVSTPGFAYAPARMLGDWSQLDGNGVVRVDVRVLSHSGTNLGSPEFLRLSGPGGSAYVSLDPADIPTSNREWRTFSFHLNASTWTVDAGTWAGLLAFVSECRMDTDFFASGGTVGFDNFGRLRDDCPRIDDPVTVYPGDIERCDVLSLIGVTGVAFNPYDGVLCGLVRNRSTNDGVYTLTGASPYTKLRTYDRPAALIFDDDGDGYVSEDFGGNIFRFVGAESSMVWVSGFHSGDDDPFGMTIAPPGFNGVNVAQGDIIVLDRGSGGPDEIWTFSPDVPEGELQLTPDPGNTDWFDLTSTPDGTVWVCDEFSDDSLFVLSPTGALTGFALGAPIGGPVSIVCDPADSLLYVASSTDQAVYRVDPATGDVTLVADGFTQLGLAGLEVGLPARRLWVSDVGANRVYELCLPVVTAVRDAPAAPSGLAMQVYPNPFNPSVTLSFQLVQPANVSLEIFDVGGRRVRTLAAGPMAEGPHALQWDGRDDRGRSVASGVYFARLRGGVGSTVRRLVLVR